LCTFGRICNRCTGCVAMATLWKCVAEPSGNPPGPPHAARSATHYVCRRRLTPLAGDKIDAPAACAVPFRLHCGGVVTRTQNVSEYMLVLALCLVVSVGTDAAAVAFRFLSLNNLRSGSAFCKQKSPVCRVTAQKCVQAFSFRLRHFRS